MAVLGADQNLIVILFLVGIPAEIGRVVDLFCGAENGNNEDCRG